MEIRTINKIIIIIIITLFPVIHLVMKHCVSYLIYYFTIVVMTSPSFGMQEDQQQNQACLYKPCNGSCLNSHHMREPSHWQRYIVLYKAKRGLA